MYNLFDHIGILTVDNSVAVRASPNNEFSYLFFIGIGTLLSHSLDV